MLKATERCARNMEPQNLVTVFGVILCLLLVLKVGMVIPSSTKYWRTNLVIIIICVF
jgi:hypothetical protein